MMVGGAGTLARKVDDEVDAATVAVMEGVEHLGQYVFEMTKAKVEALKAGGGVLPPAAVRSEEDDDDDDVEALGYGNGGIVDDEAKEEDE